MMPISPCREPESTAPTPFPEIMLLKNESALAGTEPSCTEPSLTRFYMGITTSPKTMLLVNKPPVELCVMARLNSIDEDEDEDEDEGIEEDDESTVSSSGWRTAIKNMNFDKLAKCFRPTDIQSFRVIPMSPSSYSSPRRYDNDGGEEEGKVSHEAIDYCELSYPATPSSSSSPSHTSNKNGDRGY